jgi:outer membrane protein OmpA-like peptidoglycan-associated protein
MNPSDNGQFQSSSDQFKRLRQLLWHQETKQIQQLLRYEEDLDYRSNKIAEVLAEAIQKRNTQDEQIASALQSSIQESIRTQVQQNPRLLAEVLFPIIGPSIRFAIMESLNKMMLNFEQLLENSLSTRSLLWRLEAWRTGQSFAQVVMLHTLIYQVEQVFFIHQPSGLLLSHVQAQQAIVKDPDLVSSMLTAVRDFMADSFRLKEGANLASLQLGDLTIKIKQGPYAVLAAVVRGIPPHELDDTLSETLEKLHHVFGAQLEKHKGTNLSLQQSAPLLEECLQSRFKHRKRSRIRWKAIGAIVISGALLFGWWHDYQRNQQAWQQGLQQLIDTPGILLLNRPHYRKSQAISLLVDPMATGPEQVLGPGFMQRFNVRWQSQPYASFEPSMILARAQRQLTPPEGIQLAFSKGILQITGKASSHWIDRLNHSPPVIPGVSQIDLTALYKQQQHWHKALQRLRQEPGIQILSVETLEETYRIHGLRDPLARDPEVIAAMTSEPIEWHWQPFHSLEPSIILLRAKQQLKPPSTVALKFSQGLITLQGTASASWISSLSNKRHHIYGVHTIDSHQLQLHPDKQADFQRLQQQIEDVVLEFNPGKTEANLNADQKTLLITTLEDLLFTSKILGLEMQIDIIAGTDPSGKEQSNHILSNERARRVKQQLIHAGLPGDVFKPIGSTNAIKVIHNSEDRKPQAQGRIAIFRTKTQPLNPRAPQSD